MIQAVLDTRPSKVKEFADALTADIPDPEYIKSLLNSLHEVEMASFAPALKTTNSSTYMLHFDANDYPWQDIPGQLCTQPEGSEEPVDVKAIKHSTLPCAHTIAVPYSLCALTAFLTIIKGILPEYRTSGQYRYTLRQMSEYLTALATNMRYRGLARIIYKAEDFNHIPGWGFVPTHPAFFDVSMGTPLGEYEQKKADLQPYPLGDDPIDY